MISTQGNQEGCGEKQGILSRLWVPEGSLRWHCNQCGWDTLHAKWDKAPLLGPFSPSLALVRQKEVEEFTHT